MPELPEVETVRLSLEKQIMGETIGEVRLNRADLRVPFPPRFATRLKGRTVEGIRRRAKYLLMDISGGGVWIAHLGMTGCFHVIPKGGRRPHGAHDHMELTFKSGKRLIFSDPRRFGLMALCPREELAAHPLFSHLGPEPLDPSFNAVYLAAQLKRRKTPIKVALMDQELVVGVGNIYASEVLFEASVPPQTPAHQATAHAKEIVQAIRKVLRAALRLGGSSLRDFYDAEGQSGYFQHEFKVYGRENQPCRRCKGRIARLVQGGRSSFYCPSCQK